MLIPLSTVSEFRRHDPNDPFTFLVALFDICFVDQYIRSESLSVSSHRQTMSDIEPDDSISQPTNSFLYNDDNDLVVDECTVSTTQTPSAVSEWKQSVFPTLKLSTLFHVHDHRTKHEASKFLKVNICVLDN